MSNCLNIQRKNHETQTEIVILIADERQNSREGKGEGLEQLQRVDGDDRLEGLPPQASRIRRN